MARTYSVVAGKGILSSAIATGIFGFITTILFLFCTPDLATVFSLGAPQPFVQIYALSIGKGGSIFMTIIAVIGLMLACLCSLKLRHRMIDSVTEYQCRCRGVFKACLRSCSGRRASDVKLDRSGNFGRTTQKCSHCNLYIFRRSLVHDYTKPSSLHFPGVSRRSTHDSSLRTHSFTSSDIDP